MDSHENRDWRQLKLRLGISAGRQPLRQSKDRAKMTDETAARLSKSNPLKPRCCVTKWTDLKRKKFRSRLREQPLGTTGLMRT